MIKSMTADMLRASFLSFFVEREHTHVPSASLIPTHPAAPMFTNAGMNQFLPFFLGEETPAYRRATSSQKCVRVRGKHDDIEAIGRTTRHLTFFEMLGNFSFGDYFKAGAIHYAWTFLTEILVLPPERLWVTVHESDDEAADLWNDVVHGPRGRIQRMGADNFWEMGPTGPCGPSSEIFYDKGPALGADGGPAHGGEERFVEIWNLVFMSYNRLLNGTLEPLPERNIDTGAGLERILPILQGTNSVFETDVLGSLICAAEGLTGRRYGANPEDDVSLRILADHSRAITFLVADGVVPSNEERGYVLRRIIRRAARHARRLGASRAVLPAMADAVVNVMRPGYPQFDRDLDSVRATLDREEHRFLKTLSVGLGMLEDVFSSGASEVTGELAFKLHDTFGFPIDLTREIARERGATVDGKGFETAMDRQRELARASGGHGPLHEQADRYRLLLQEHGPTEFVGYECTGTSGRIVSTLDSNGLIEVFTDRTPFYAESGGQVGDTGTIETETGRGNVIETTAPLAGLVRHLVRIQSGSMDVGQGARLEVDSDRRESIRRNHTATHLLHWALRTIIGAHVHQQGSLVDADHLRFDFNHHSGLTPDELRHVEDAVTGQILSNGVVRVASMSRSEAEEVRALSFFGEKYGEVVRVVRAGGESTELCGGTHVEALGQIGGFIILGESSVGSNLRRIEAVTGRNALREFRRRTDLLRSTAQTLRVNPDDLPDAAERLLDSQKKIEHECRRLSQQVDNYLASEIAGESEDGVVVARFDGRPQSALRSLALAVRESKGKGIKAVGLIGTPDGASVCIVVALTDGLGNAGAVARAVAQVVGGKGGGKDPLLAVAGGRDVGRINDALDILRSRLRGTIPVTSTP